MYRHTTVGVREELVAFVNQLVVCSAWPACILYRVNRRGYSVKSKLVSNKRAYTVCDAHGQCSCYFIFVFMLVYALDTTIKIRFWCI